MTDVNEYWIGENVDYDSVWKAYEEGDGYKDKFTEIQVHLFRIKFREQPRNLPLYNHEAVFKTLKGYFHDLKKACWSEIEFELAGPLYFYSVERDSGIWSFFGELGQLLLYGTSLAREKILGQQLENIDKRFDILRKHFGNNVPVEAFEQFMSAKTPRSLQRAFDNLIRQGIERVEISQQPFQGDIQDVKSTLIDLKEILGDDGEQEIKLISK